MSRQILDMSNDKLEELFNKTNDNFEEVYQDNSEQESILATKAKQTDLDTLKARVDNLIANPGESTEGNAELLDIRVGFDGKTYPTAGEAVREQLSDLDNKFKFMNYTNLVENFDMLEDKYLSDVIDQSTISDIHDSSIGNNILAITQVEPDLTYQISNKVTKGSLRIHKYDKSGLLKEVLFLDPNRILTISSLSENYELGYLALVSTNKSGINLIILDDFSFLGFDELETNQDIRSVKINDYRINKINKSLLVADNLLPEEVISRYNDFLLAVNSGPVLVYSDVNPEISSNKNFSVHVEGKSSIDINVFVWFYKDNQAIGSANYRFKKPGDLVLRFSIPAECDKAQLSIRNYGNSDLLVSKPYYGNSEYFDNFQRLESMMNPLQQKTLFCTGDSITQGANNQGKSYMTKIAEKYGMVLTNIAVGGGTFVHTIKPDGSERYDITAGIDEVVASSTNYDYIIVSGGYNDSQTSISNPLGTIDPDDYTGDYDTSTVLGCVEHICYNLINRYPTKKIGFVLTYKVHKQWDTYREKIIEALKKWSIPYCDLGSNSHLICKEGLATKNQIFTDGIHPNDQGYEMIADIVGSWIMTL